VDASFSALRMAFIILVVFALSGNVIASGQQDLMQDRQKTTQILGFLTFSFGLAFSSTSKT